MADRDAIIRIGDDPFKISYMEYDTDRYEELLQSKIDIVMAKLPPSIKTQIVSTDIIRSPVKHFRQRCRFAVMPLNSSSSNACQPERDLESDSQSLEATPTSSSKIPNSTVCSLNSEIIPPLTVETTEVASDTSSQSNDVNTSLTYVLWENGGPNIYVDAFPIASIAIYNAMPLFLAHIQTIEVLRNNLRAINFLSTRNGDLLATIIYDLEMGETWDAMATEMCSKLGKNDCIVCIYFQHLNCLLCALPPCSGIQYLLPILNT
jgi:tRNA (Uracil-5-)-methyltransferase